MTLYDLFPFLNGYKTLISGLGTFLGAFAAVLAVLAQLLTGSVGIAAFIHQAAPLWITLMTALAGLGIWGIGHKLVKAQTTTVVNNNVQPIQPQTAGQ